MGRWTQAQAGRGMSKKRFKGRMPPFVPLLKDTLKTPAWKALSYGARSLYVVLKWRYNNNLMNHVYVSTRVAAQELGAGRNSVRLWFHELAYYGFIAMVSPAHHGVDGHGKAPCWRLTEEKYLGKEPTRDFLHWNGTLFTEKRNPPRLHTIKKIEPEAPTRVPVWLRRGCQLVPEFDPEMEQVAPTRVP